MSNDENGSDNDALNPSENEGPTRERRTRKTKRSSEISYARKSKSPAKKRGIHRRRNKHWSW